MTFFESRLKSLSNITLNDTQINQFKTYYDTLITYNAHTNLTSITDETSFIIKHIIDSIWILNHVSIQSETRVLDIGSGAGFPGIPLKIMNPNIHMTLLDSNGKKITFLKHLIDILNLDIDVIKDRAEVYANTHEKSFDVVVSRAVADLPLLLELSIPLLKEKGHFYAFKASSAYEELERSNRALKILHSKKINTYDFELPNQSGRRTIIDIQKNKHIKGYPRTYQRMMKKGL